MTYCDSDNWPERALLKHKNSMFGQVGFCPDMRVGMRLFPLFAGFMLGQWISCHSFAIIRSMNSSLRVYQTICHSILSRRLRIWSKYILIERIHCLGIRKCSTAFAIYSDCLASSETDETRSREHSKRYQGPSCLDACTVLPDKVEAPEPRGTQTRGCGVCKLDIRTDWGSRAWRPWLPTTAIAKD